MVSAAGLLSLLLLLILPRGLKESSSTIITPTNAKSGLATGVGRSFRYFRLGQWRADARTLVAMLDYLLQDVPPDQPAWVPPALEVAMPTNSVSHPPKV